MLFLQTADLYYSGIIVKYSPLGKTLIILFIWSVLNHDTDCTIYYSAVHCLSWFISCEANLGNFNRCSSECEPSIYIYINRAHNSHLIILQLHHDVLLQSTFTIHFLSNILHVHVLSVCKITQNVKDISIESHISIL